MAAKLVINFVDREGNKKAASYECAESTTVETADTFVGVVKAQSGARVLSYTVVQPAVAVTTDVYTAGNFDLVGEVARLRFVDEGNTAFAAIIPAPIDAALDTNEEVSIACATAMATALATLRGEDAVHYRGGRLIVKDVSNPVLIPVITSGT